MENKKTKKSSKLNVPGLYKLHIPENVERKIREWCNECPNNEWSGTLFYKTEGSFENNDLSVNVVDFYVSDIGTSTYTVYDFNEEVVAYMTDKDLLDCYCGLVHSHQQMSAFFSGTDVSTLEKEGANMPHFVSLIVNNAGQYVARITRQVIKTFSGVVDGYYLSFNNERKEINSSTATFNKTTVEYFDLEIQKEEVILPVNETHLRAEEIRSKKKREETNVFPSYFNQYKEPNQFKSTAKEPLLFPEFNKENTSDVDEKENLYSFPEYELGLYASKILQGEPTANYMQTSEIVKFIGKDKNSPMVKAIKKKFPKDTEDEYRAAVCDVLDFIIDLAVNKRGCNFNGFCLELLSALYEFLDDLLAENRVYNDFVDVAMDELLTYQSMVTYYE